MQQSNRQNGVSVSMYVFEPMNNAGLPKIERILGIFIQILTSSHDIMSDVVMLCQNVLDPLTFPSLSVSVALSDPSGEMACARCEVIFGLKPEDYIGYLSEDDRETMQKHKTELHIGASRGRTNPTK
jgi:hypothetical protein